MSPGFSWFWPWTESYPGSFPSSEAFGRGLSHVTGIPESPPYGLPVMPFLRHHD
jgi:hypothetical protein